MLIRRIIIRLRIALTILFVLSLIAIISGLFYLNSTGLNKEIRSHISNELEQRGIYVEFDSLKYQISDGLVAKNVHLYGDQNRLTKLASLPEVSINLDKTKLLRGIRKINSLSLTNADIEFPLNPHDKSSVRLKIQKINGNIEFPQTGVISSNRITAKYLGIDITLAGNLWQDLDKSNSPVSPEADKQRALAYQNFLDYFSKWSWDPATPPDLSLFLEGNINSPEKIKIEFELVAPKIDYEGYSITKLDTLGDLSHNLLTIDSLYFKNGRKEAHVEIDYDFTIRDGRFHVDSNVQIQDFVRTFFDRELFKGFSIHGGSEIKAEGSFKLPTKKDDMSFASTLPSFLDPFTELDIKVTGNAKLTSYEYLGSKFDSFNSDFSWNNGDVYLDKLNMKSGSRYLQGRLLIKNNMITYDTETTLSKKAFLPFIKKDGRVEAIFNDIKLSPDSEVFCKTKGTINAKDLTDWISDGEIKISKLTYKGIYSESLTSKFQWVDGSLQGNANLKHSKYKDFALENLDTEFNWINGTLQGNAKIQNSHYKDLAFEQLDTQFRWKDDKLVGTASLEKSLYKNISFQKMDSNFNWENGILRGSATIKNSNSKDLSFQQLDSSIHWKDKVLNAKINISKPVLKASPLNSFKATLSLANQQLRLTDISAEHSSGNLTGSFYTSHDYYHFDLISTMDPYILIPFIKNPKTVDFLSQANINEQSKSYISAKGKLSRTDKTDWESQGQATFTELGFNNVPLHSIKSDYQINNQRLLATNSRLVFNYQNYKLYKLFKGSSKGEITIAKALIDNDAKTASIEGAKGRVHPAPVARLFHNEIADHLEEYQFYTPPTLIASGVFDTTSRPINDQKMNFNCELSCPDSTARYMFLDGNLLLKNFSANIQCLKNQVKIRNIRCRMMDKGLAQGNLYFVVPPNAPVTYHGDINWQNINFRQLGITYNFDEVQRGRLRGNIQFQGIADDIASFSTKKGTMGNFALENGNLYSVPVLGPVSIIINPFISPLAGSQPLNERLKNISARFKVINGVIITNDIQSLTPSLTFFGEGSVNLNNDKIDITVRVNYRGLLGKAMELGAEIIKLPFHLLRSVFLNKKPAETGLIQVRGIGHYKDPSWKLVPFDPPRDFNVPLFKPGKARAIPMAKPIE